MSDEPNELLEQAMPEPDASIAAEDQAAPPVDDITEDDMTEEGVTEEGAAEEGAAEEVVAEEAAEDETAAAVEEVDVEVDVDDEVEQEEESAEAAEQVEEASEEPAADEAPKMDWYILKVQSNRERSIADALRRKIAIEGLDEFFGDVVVPMEKVTEFKAGKKKVVQRKLYPGYIVVHMLINDDTWFAVRETSGIGDFTGSGGKPTPMLPHEVARLIQTEEEETDEAPKLNIAFSLGDRVKVKEGTFESFEGEVNAIDEHSGRVTVMINIFGRSTPVELEYWQAEQV